MEYQITHITEYEYEQPIGLCHNTARLALRDTTDQQCKRTTVQVSPQPDQINEYLDFFGNKVIYFAIQREHKNLKVTVQSIVEKKPISGIPLNLYTDIPWTDVRLQLHEKGAAHLEARQYIHHTDFTRPDEEIHRYALQSFTAGRSMYDATKDLMQRIFYDFDFTQGFTTVSTPLTEVMKTRKGVCQDFAHLAIACIRSMGLPARYVSGYIETIPPKGQEKLFGVDASHAWFSVYIPNTGWIDFDPTNNIIPGAQHITIGWGRDYADVTPLKGVILASGKHALQVSVDVRRLG